MSTQSSRPQNKAAWQNAANDTRLEIRDAPYPTPREHEIVIKNRAVAINPIDWILQQLGNAFIFQWLKYPMILGYDAAGEVVEVGSGVTRFKVGDRVLGMMVGHDEKIGRYEEAAFQLFPVLREDMASPIPERYSYEEASTLPLGIGTAACGLFQEHLLNLQWPTLNPKPTGKTVIIWGGSSSVGINAIQLATAAGYEVVTTCSPRNYDLVKRVGAVQAFDYNSKTIVNDMIAFLKNKVMVGAMAIGDGGVDSCMCILQACQGRKFVAVATKSKLPDPNASLATMKVLYNYVSFNSNLMFKSKTRGVDYGLIFADTLVHDGVGRAVFADYLPEALAQGKYVVAPEPVIVGKGLESIQEGFEVQRKGVSAKKVVVSL